MKNKDNIISAIDVGTTKIAVLIGNYDLQNSRFEILGFGESKSEGLKRGIVINISKTIDSIRSAVEKAESKAGISINSALVGISGEHIKGINGSSAININNPQGNNNPGQPITKSDKNRVIEQSQSINLSPDRRVLHVLSQNFVVDNNKDVKNPVGLSCQRLEANVHIVTVGKNSEMDLVSCMKEIGIEVVDKFIFEPLASAHSVLTVDERELGVVMLDIGGGTTDMIVYKNGGVVDISAIPIGGEAITKDIAIGLQLSMEEAEEIKKKHGSAKVALATDDELVSINQSFNINNKKISEKN